MKGTITIQGKTYTEWPDLVANDVGFTIQFNLLLNDETTPFDLTAATVLFKAKLLDGNTNKIEGACALSGTPTDGIATYVVQSGDLDTAGVLDTEIEVTQGSEVNTAKLGRLTILSDLPN